MIPAFETVDPDDRIPYWFDATDRAADDGRTVVSYELAIDDPQDGALTLAGEARSGAVVSFYPVGATEFVTYIIRCRFHYDNGDHFDVSGSITGEQH